MGEGLLGGGEDGVVVFGFFLSYVLIEVVGWVVGFESVIGRGRGGGWRGLEGDVAGLGMASGMGGPGSW